MMRGAAVGIRRNDELASVYKRPVPRRPPRLHPVSPARLTIWLLALTLLAGCTAPVRSGGFGQPAPHKRISTAITGEPRTLSSTLAELTPGGGVRGPGEAEQLLHVGLANTSDSGVLSPRLAEEVPTIENGLWKLLPDGRMETNWRIRQGAQWHDGTPFTTEDLAFTAAIGQDPELPLLRRRLGYSAIESVDVVDPRTITVRWKTPFIEADSLFTHLLAMPMPRHLLGTTYPEMKANLLELPYWNQQFIGAGPYRIREWVQGSHMVLEAFASYALGRAKIDEIEVKFIPDPTTRMSNILGGAVELTMGLGLSINQGRPAPRSVARGAVERLPRQRPGAPPAASEPPTGDHRGRQFPASVDSLDRSAGARGDAPARLLRGAAQLPQSNRARVRANQSRRRPP